VTLISLRSIRWRPHDLFEGGGRLRRPPGAPL